MSITYRVIGSRDDWGGHELVAIYEDGELRGNALRCYTTQHDNSVSLNCTQFRRAQEYKIHGVLFEIDKNVHKMKLLKLKDVENIVSRINIRKGDNGRGDYWVIPWYDIEHPGTSGEYPIEGQQSMPF